MDQNELLDAMIRGSQVNYADNDPGVLSAPTSAPQVQAEAKTAPSSILDLMQNPSAPPPALPQSKDLGMLPALALLHFAAAVSQPRYGGQGTLGKITESMGSTADYAMAEKQAMEQQAVQQELQRRQIAESDAKLEQTKLANVATRQSVMQAERTQPLQLQQLQLAVQNATSDQQIKAITIRLDQLKEKYAEQEMQAGIAEKAAKTDQDRAMAALAVSHARYFLDSLEKVREQAAGKGAPRSFTSKETLPGEPPMVTDATSGQVFRAPMEAPADALAWAQRQAQAEADFAKGQGKGLTAAEQRLRINYWYHEAQKGNVPPVVPKETPTPSSPQETSVMLPSGTSVAIPGSSGAHPTKLGPAVPGLTEASITGSIPAATQAKADQARTSILLQEKAQNDAQGQIDPALEKELALRGGYPKMTAVQLNAEAQEAGKQPQGRLIQGPSGRYYFNGQPVSPEQAAQLAEKARTRGNAAAVATPAASAINVPGRAPNKTIIYQGASPRAADLPPIQLPMAPPQVSIDRGGS